jgi:hypothetical protein
VNSTTTYYKNFCKCHNVPPSIIIIFKKKSFKKFLCPWVSSGKNWGQVAKSRGSVKVLLCLEGKIHCGRDLIPGHTEQLHSVTSKESGGEKVGSWKT